MTPLAFHPTLDMEVTWFILSGLRTHIYMPLLGNLHEVVDSSSPELESR